MKTSSFLVIVCFSTFVFLFGCGTKSVPVITQETSEETISSWTIKATGISLCDNYLSSLQCIASYATGAEKINFNSSYESLVQSFQNVPVDQLTETCTTLSNALRSHPTLLQDYPKCNIL
jgi:hypothetical protein